jgi:hypothetical protein
VEGKEPAPTPEEKKEEAKDAAPTTTSASGGAQAGGDFRSYGGHDATHASVAKVNIELAAKGLRLHKQEGKERFILGGKGTDRTEDSYIRSSGGGDLKGFKEFRLAGDTLLAEYAAGISYIDVGRGLRAEKYERDGYIYYKGFYTNEATKAFSGTDAEAFADALLKMGYSQSLIRTIAGRAAAIVKANTSQAPTFWAYHTEDGVKTAKISFPNGTEAEIYPGDGSVVIAYPDIGQKGIVFDFKEQGIPSEFTAQSFNVPSAESLKVGEDVSENVVALGKEDVAEASDLDSARLYKATKGSRSAWYLKFKITSGSKKAFVTPQMLVFEDRPADPAKSGSRSEFPGKGIVIGGVDLGALKNAEELNIKPDWTPTTGQPWKLKFVKMADGAPKDKGAIALVDPTGMQRFIAVVAYWGVTKEAAEERAKQKGV